MDCQETPEGYKVMYTPMAPGNYLIGVKYGGPNHIMGSPFKAKVTGNNESPLKLFLQPLKLILSN
jgi:filamin